MSKHDIKAPGPLPAFSHPLHLPFKVWATALLHHPIELLAIATLLLLSLGGTLLYFAERGGGGSIHSWWDALWLCATSATTDSYGDVAPSTPLSRVIAITIACLGIVIAGSFIASITNFISGQTSPDKERLDDLRERLERIEALLKGRP
jgi:voltage-gated potassium channel